MAHSSSVDDSTNALAIALRQMDGFLAGSPPRSPISSQLSVRKIAEELKMTIDLNTDDVKASDVPLLTRQFLLVWLCGDGENLTVASGTEGSASSQITADLEEKAKKLETDKKSLQLQVHVLTEQVEVQAEKIKELEQMADSKKEKIHSMEKLLKQETKLRQTLENYRSELQRDIAALKLQLGDSEKSIMARQESLHSAQIELQLLQSKLSDRDQQLNELRNKLKKDGSLVSTFSSDSESDRTFNCNTNTRLKRKTAEVERLRRAMDNMLSANEEKDKVIEELKKTLTRYQKVQEVIMEGHRKDLEMSDPSLMLQLMKMQNNPSPRSSYIESVPTSLENNVIRPNGMPRSYPTTPSRTPPGTLNKLVRSKTPPSTFNRTTYAYNQPLANQFVSLMPVADALDTPSNKSPNNTPPSTLDKKTKSKSNKGVRSLSIGNGITAEGKTKSKQSPSPSTANRGVSTKDVPAAAVTGVVAKVTPTARAHNRSLGTHKPKSCEELTTHLTTSLSFSPNSKQMATLGNKHTSSDESDSVFWRSFEGRQSATMSQSHKEPKKFWRIFNKKRSQSDSTKQPQRPQSVIQTNEIVRGGVTRTSLASGQRSLGWSMEFRHPELDVPFANWDSDQVALWVHGMGLTQYVTNCRNWVKNGEHLLRATPQDLEMELGVKNTLHRKKLQLALQEIGSEEECVAGDLDYQWVTTWLDDVGLPQYKDAFSEARIDGRMLHYLTIEDLLIMKITNSFHHVSLKRGIQLLRMHHFDPYCVQRRPVDDYPVLNEPKEVVLWSNHRVMEWLRSVDLSEYAPNLRGSGVHGALIILEPRFNVDLLSQLLNIPHNKTLLRRHLSTHFSALVGADCLRVKRESETKPDFHSLNPSQKVKVGKKSGIFRRKSKPEVELDEYVCPMDLTGPNLNFLAARPILRLHSDPLLYRIDRKKDEEVAREVGAFSKEINCLTSNLNKDSKSASKKAR